MGTQMNPSPQAPAPHKSRRSLIIVIAAIVVAAIVMGAVVLVSIRAPKPASIAILYMWPGIDHYQCYFVLTDMSGEEISSDGTVQLMLADDLNVTIYDRTFSINKSDFQHFATLLDFDRLGYVWDLPFDDIQKTDSRNYSFEASMVFTKGDLVLTYSNPSVLIPTSLYAPNTPPVTQISGPTESWTDVYTEFNAAGTFDINFDYLFYEWDFGDGESLSFGTTATHKYATNGTFTVVVTVADGQGGEDNASMVIDIRNPEAISILATDLVTDEFGTSTYSIQLSMVNQAPVDISVWGYGYDIEYAGGAIYAGWANGNPSGLAPGGSAQWTVEFNNVPSSELPVRMIYDDRVCVQLA
jgi:hypothetical protein